MTTQALITCLIFVAVVILLIWQPVHPVVIGAAIPAVLVAFGIIDGKTAYTEFGNTTVVFFMGLMVVGEAFFKTGLADFIGSKIIGLTGKSEKGLVVGTSIAAGTFSAFLNDTGSTACLMPIVGSMAEKSNISKSKLLMALAYASSLGGTITLIGTTPHIVANGLLVENGLREFTFFEYSKIGIPLLIVGIIYMIVAGTKLLPDKDIELETRETPNYNKKKMITSAVIFFFVVLAMFTNVFPGHIAGVFGAILVVLTGCITAEEAIDSFSITTVFLVGGIFPLSKALVSTGAAEYFVDKLSPYLNGLSPIMLIGAIGLLMLVVTQFLLNSSATVLVLPIAILLCEAAGVNPLAGAMIVSICASGVFTTPFGTGPNLIVWDAGGYSIKDYFKCGFPLLILFWLTSTILISIFYL